MFCVLKGFNFSCDGNDMRNIVQHNDLADIKPVRTAILHAEFGFQIVKAIFFNPQQVWRDHWVIPQFLAKFFR